MLQHLIAFSLAQRVQCEAAEQLTLVLGHHATPIKSRSLFIPSRMPA